MEATFLCFFKYGSTKTIKNNLNLNLKIKVCCPLLFKACISFPLCMSQFLLFIKSLSYNLHHVWHALYFTTLTSLYISIITSSLYFNEFTNFKFDNFMALNIPRYISVNTTVLYGRKSVKGYLRLAISSLFVKGSSYLCNKFNWETA